MVGISLLEEVGDGREVIPQVSGPVLPCDSRGAGQPFGSQEEPHTPATYLRVHRGPKEAGMCQG